MIVVILSNEPKKLSACAAAVRAQSVEADVLAVTGPGVPLGGLADVSYLPQRVEKFCYAREVNRALSLPHVEAEDVALLGDDVTLHDSGTIAQLRDASKAHGDALTSPAFTGRVALDGGRWGNWMRPSKLESERVVDCVPFFCVFLPSELRAKVGPLDERFTKYGSEDLDYCKRAKGAGFSIMVLPGIVAHHAEEPRAAHLARWGADAFAPGGGVDLTKYHEKWGRA